MRYTASCPWCHERVEVDDRPIDGGPKAVQHMRRCPFSPLRDGHTPTAVTDRTEDHPSRALGAKSP